MQSRKQLDGLRNKTSCQIIREVINSERVHLTTH